MEGVIYRKVIIRLYEGCKVFRDNVFWMCGWNSVFLDVYIFIL